MINFLFSEILVIKNYLKMVLSCRYALGKIDPSSKITKNKKLFIYISDWLSSPAPIFNIYLSILLKKKGYKVFMLVDTFNLYNPVRSYITNYLTQYILKYINVRFDIALITISKKNISNQKIDKKIINECIKFNLMRYQKDVRPSRLKKNTEERKKNDLINVYKNLIDLIKTNKKTKILFLNSGGFLNSSYIVTKLLKTYKKNYYTFDSCPYGNDYAIWYCKNGIAGKLQDSRASYDELNKDNYFKKNIFRSIERKVLKEINLRRLNKDKFKFQKNSNLSKKLNIKNYVMITTNSGWDANSLGSNYLFKDYIEYLKKTLSYINKNFPNMKIIVKEHPHKKKYFNQSSSLEKYLLKLKGENIIKIDSSYNFYDLIKNCKLLISIASTTINEALILGKPAISAGRDKYFYFDLNVNPINQKKYFGNIKKILNNKKVFKFKKKENIVFYYFNQHVRLFKTDFNPQHYSWIKKGFQNLNQSKHFKFLYKMIETEKNFFTSRIR